MSNEQTEKLEYMRKYEETLRMRSDMRGHHYLLCTHMDEFRRAVEQIEMDEKVRAELLNLATVVMRMAVIHNGAGMSPCRVPAY